MLWIWGPGCAQRLTLGFHRGRAIARGRAGTRLWLLLGAINRASSNKHFPCGERHPEYDPFLSIRLAHLKNSFSERTL